MELARLKNVSCLLQIRERAGERETDGSDGLPVELQVPVDLDESRRSIL
jgi:hypothetical protein